MRKFFAKKAERSALNGDFNIAFMGNLSGIGGRVRRIGIDRWEETNNNERDPNGGLVRG